MKRGAERGYFPKPAKSLFILDNPGEKEAAKKEFVKEGLVLNFVSGSWYLGAYLGPREQLEALVKPQVEAWAGTPSRLTPAWEYYCNSSGSTCKGLSPELAL